MSPSPYDILVKPLITERAMNLLEQNQYVFEVSLTANKTEIRKAIEKAFGVKVVAVNTIRTKGVAVRKFRMSPGKRPDVKKAIVTLAPGQALEYT